MLSVGSRLRKESLSLKPLPLLLCLAYYTKRGTKHHMWKPLFAIVWIPEFISALIGALLLITCIQSSRTQQADNSLIFRPSAACAFKWENLYHFPRKYKWTTWATKAPVWDSTPYFPLLEGLDWRGRQEGKFWINFWSFCWAFLNFPPEKCQETNYNADSMHLYFQIHYLS